MRTLKTILKIAAVAVVPGAGVYYLVRSILKELERAEFRAHIRRTYGEGSKYEDRYSTDYVDRH